MLIKPLWFDIPWFHHYHDPCFTYLLRANMLHTWHKNTHVCMLERLSWSICYRCFLLFELLVCQLLNITEYLFIWCITSVCNFMCFFKDFFYRTFWRYFSKTFWYIFQMLILYIFCNFNLFSNLPNFFLKNLNTLYIYIRTKNLLVEITAKVRE